MADEQDEGRARDDEQGKGTPDELTERLIELARNGSAEEIQRAESLMRIAAEVKQSRMDVQRAQIEMHDQRIAEHEQRIEQASERIAAITTAMAEALKLHFEAYKNLTVLDSGALVAFAAVTHYLVPSPVQQSFLSAAYAFVLLSLVSSLVMTFVVGDQVLDVMRPDAPPSRGRVWRIGIRVVDGLAMLAFIVGIVLFLLFLSANL